MEHRFDVGDMIKLVSENFPNDWYIGKGLIVAIENNNYRVLVFDLTKISRKRLTEVKLGQQYIDFPINEADENGFFELIF